MNRYARAAKVKSWKEDTAAAWLTVPPTEKQNYPRDDGEPRWFTPSIIRLHIGFPQKRRRDPHNYCGTVLKSVIDALVEVRLWPDDTPDWVGHREPFLIDGSLTHVEVWPQ